MDWYELRLRLSLWFKQSWPFTCLAWLLSKKVQEQRGFGRFKEREGLEMLVLSRLREKSQAVEVDLDNLPGDKCEADAWWEQEIQVLQIQSVKAKVEARIEALQKQQDERYKTGLVSVCTGGVAVAFLIAMYAIRYL